MMMTEAMELLLRDCLFLMVVAVVLCLVIVYYEGGNDE